MIEVEKEEQMYRRITIWIEELQFAFRKSLNCSIFIINVPNINMCFFPW